MYTKTKKHIIFGSGIWRTIWSITLTAILLITSLSSPTLASNLPPVDLAQKPVLVEADPPPPVWGIADLHNHQFGNLGFGGLMIWGDVFNAEDDIAKALPWSDFMPAQYGDVLGRDGLPIMPTPFWGLPPYPNLPATCEGAWPCWGVPIHGAGGDRDLLNAFLTGSLGHLVAGYPQFDGYPRWNTYTGQTMYYRWLERAWREGGLRLMVMLAVNNEAICGLLYRKAGYGCDDMPAIDRQIQAAKGLEAFIDRQNDGELDGDGWYQIAYSPTQARQIINAGNLAVVLGIETPSLFGCKVHSDCTNEYVLSELRRYRDMGVRHIYPLHNADNGFGGTGLYNEIFEFNNKVINGEWFDVTNECDPYVDFHLDIVDRLLDGENPAQGSYLASIVNLALGGGAPLPRPPAGPNCNARRLTDLGTTLINGLMDLKMIIDIDHLSTRTFNDVMTLVEGRNYPGIVASHTGFSALGLPRGSAETNRYEPNKTPEQFERIRLLGGNIGVIIHQGDRASLQTYIRDPDLPPPVRYNCGSSSEAWAQAYLYAVDHMQGGAIGLGTDLNGLAGVPAPRFGPERCHGDNDPTYNPGNPVVYATDPSQGLTKMVIGERAFDYNYDGFANIGMLPDFIQDVRNIGVSEADLAPLFSSAESYLRMWEAVGDLVPPPATNAAPSAHAGGPYLAPVGQTVSLQGSGSDPEGETVAFSWDLDGNGVFETSGASASFNSSGANRDVPVVMRACDPYGVCATSRTFIHVRSTGRVMAWGGDESGQLGVPSTSFGTCPAGSGACSRSPVAVPGLRDVIEVAAGNAHSLALKSDGTVWAWGGNRGPTPVQISGLTGVVSIAAGDGHTLALKSDGSVWAWGRNNNGQLGTGNRTDQSTPIRVPGIGPATAIAAGDFFSLALLDNGDIMGWGLNNFYQLGSQYACDPSNLALPYCLSPVQLSLSGADVLGIAAGRGWTHTWNTDGTVWALGSNDLTTNVRRRTPTAVPSLNGVTEISTGFGDHVLGLRPDGSVWGYGSNNEGELGLNCINSVTMSGWCWPASAVSGDTGAQAIAAGTAHSLALDSAGNVRSWGNNVYYQLGRTTSGRNDATPSFVEWLTGALDVAAGRNHNLVILPTTASVTLQPNAPASLTLLNGRGVLELPAGMVSSPTTFTYTFQDAPSAAAAGGLGTLRFAGMSFTLTATDAGGNAVTTFPYPFTLRLYYEDEDWQRAGITDEQYLNLSWWDPASSQWRSALPCQGCSLDTTNNALTVKLNHLTEFALLGVQDTTPPTVTASHAPEANGDGWYNADTEVTLTAVDNVNGLGVSSVNYSATGAQATAYPVIVYSDTAMLTISTEGSTTITYSAQDRANNVSADQTDTVNLDKTAPVTVVALTGTAGQNGWYTADVTATLTSTDTLSGLKLIEYSLDDGATYSTYTDPLITTQEGTTTLLARAIDNADNTESPVTTAIKIDMTAPTIAMITPEPYAVLPVGTALNFGAGDATSGIQSVSATLDNSTTLVSESVGNGYVLSQAGVYTLVVQASDVAGNQSVETLYFVVFDPNGGFVTGGGWIDSPAGAYRADLSLSGKATFGFVSKYLKGAMAPSGTTQFLFHVADLDFDSTSYEWLVINQTGTNAQFKGSGTINHAGSYRFMLWAGDSSPDSFRIRIWEEVNGVESVVYDNGVEQPIGGGAVIVHKK